MPQHANVHHVKDLYDSSVEFFALRNPFVPFHGHSSTTNDNHLLPSDTTDPDPASRAQNLTPVQHLRLDKLTRGRASRRRRGEGQSTERRPGSNGCSPQTRPDLPASMALSSIRNELDITLKELARVQVERTKYLQRCKDLEKALKDTTDVLRSREREVDDLKRERERISLMRRNSQSTDRSPTTPRSSGPTPIPSRTTVSVSSRDPYDDDLDYEDKNRPRLRRAASSTFSSRMNRSTPPIPQSHSLNITDSSTFASMRGLEVFLTKTDSWSGAQVIEAVQDLNSEILQLSAAAAELTTLAHRRAKYPPAKVAQAAKDTASRLGPTFARILATRNHSQDPTLIQFSLQACMTTCTARLLSGFCIGFPIMPNELFSQLYFHMQATEPQATSSRWRALALSHIRALNPRLEEHAVFEFVDVILRAYADIFVLCGCIHTDVPLTSADALKARFGQQVRRIAIAACHLARVIKEEIMSTNFELILVEQARPYDTATMTNAFGGYAASKGSVLCTTELGLRCSTRKTVNVKAMDGTAKGVAVNGAQGIERTVLLQPKVVLESVAQVFEPAVEQ